MIEAEWGIRPGYGGKHPGHGTHNALLSLGHRTYLEVLSPDPEQPDPSAPRQFGIDGVREPGLRGWAVATKKIDTRVTKARDAGYHPGEIVDQSRRLPSGEVLRWRLTVSPDCDGATVVPFLIDWGSCPHPSATAPGGITLLDFRIGHPTPLTLRGRLAALGVDVPVDEADEPALIATLLTPNGQVVLR